MILDEPGQQLLNFNNARIAHNQSVELTSLRPKELRLGTAACSLRVYRKGRANSTLIRVAAHFHVVLLFEK